MSLIKFLPHEVDAIRTYYDDQGYVVVQNLLDHAKIEAVINQYEEIKKSKTFVFFSQDTHLPVQPKLTPEGFIENSMLNPADLKLRPRFSSSIEKCLVDEKVVSVLGLLSQASSHVMMQNMFFDKSTGTVEHQDHYYLDADPPGKMIAVWYALEDIHDDAGCFFVLPGSHKGAVVERENGSNFSDHDSFVKAIHQLIMQGGYEYRSFPLNKGDVIFWHPYTIHGAFNNQNPHHSRKSLTAHYYPGHMKSLYSTKAPNLRKSINPSILIETAKQGPYLSNAKFYLQAAVNHLRGRGPDYDMRRNSYAAEQTADS